MTFVLSVVPTVCLRTVCVEAEQKNAKQNNRSWFERLLTIREYQNFLEEGKLVVGVASVACVVSRRCPIFMILASCKNTVGSYRFFQILSCILPLVELV